MQQPDAQPVLELRSLSKSFGGLHAVQNVSLKIFSGDRKAIIGPNGAGKTTLFNVITGTLPASSGQAILFGSDITHWPSHRRTAMGMARTFQVTNLFPKLTVTVRVVPLPEVERTLIVSVRTAEHAFDVMRAALGSANDVSSAAFDPERGVALKLK